MTLPPPPNQTEPSQAEHNPPPPLLWTEGQTRLQTLPSLILYSWSVINVTAFVLILTSKFRAGILERDDKLTDDLLNKTENLKNVTQNIMELFTTNDDLSEDLENYDVKTLYLTDMCGAIAVTVNETMTAMYDRACHIESLVSDLPSLDILDTTMIQLCGYYCLESCTGSFPPSKMGFPSQVLLKYQVCLMDDNSNNDGNTSSDQYVQVSRVFQHKVNLTHQIYIQAWNYIWGVLKVSTEKNCLQSYPILPTIHMLLDRLLTKVCFICHFTFWTWIISRIKMISDVNSGLKCKIWFCREKLDCFICLLLGRLWENHKWRTRWFCGSGTPCTRS